ncbi:MAG: DUF4178 domain-containing protein [Nevskia sp.]
MAETQGSEPPAAPVPQRRFVAPCPNCGAPVPFVSAASAMAVCGYCRSTVVRDGDSLRRIGESAELIDDRSRLQLGASGRHGARAFALVGRQQCGYGAGETLAGTWNEWHLAFADGRSGWLSEDNDQYVIVFDIELDKPPPPASELSIGQPVWLVDLRWQVASIVEARPLAAQGELPAPPALGRRYAIVDLRNEQAQVATLDYADAAQPQLSVGQSVRLESLQLQGLREDPDAGAKTLAAQRFACPECGASVEVTRADTRSITCGSCHSVVDLSRGAGADLQAYRQNQRYEPKIPLGSVGLLALAGGGRLSWQVVGFSAKRAHAGHDDASFDWQDYLLYNEQEGFAFLIDSEDGWTGFRTLTGVPKTIGAGAAVEWNGSRYRLMERYPATVLYVQGEFYWQVARAQLTQTSDYHGIGAAAKLRLSSERTNEEIVWSQGATMPAADIEAAFKLSGLQRERLVADVGPVSGGQTISWIVWLVVIIVLLLVLSECGSGGGYYGTTGGSYGGYSSGGGHK